MLVNSCYSDNSQALNSQFSVIGILQPPIATCLARQTVLPQLNKAPCNYVALVSNTRTNSTLRIIPTQPYEFFPLNLTNFSHSTLRIYSLAWGHDGSIIRQTSNLDSDLFSVLGGPQATVIVDWVKTSSEGLTRRHRLGPGPLLLPSPPCPGPGPACPPAPEPGWP